jgi:hypothetical protein
MIMTQYGLTGRYQHFKNVVSNFSSEDGDGKFLQNVGIYLVSTYESTWCHNPEEHHHLHCHENLKSHTK